MPASRSSDLRLEAPQGADLVPDVEVEATIEDAKVKLSVRSGILPSVAYAAMVQESQRTNRKLRVVAADVLHRAGRQA